MHIYKGYHMQTVHALYQECMWITDEKRKKHELHIYMDKSCTCWKKKIKKMNKNMYKNWATIWIWYQGNELVVGNGDGWDTEGENLLKLFFFCNLIVSIMNINI